MGEDLTIELLEVLELYCELLLARFGLLETVKCVWGCLKSCGVEPEPELTRPSLGLQGG